MIRQRWWGALLDGRQVVERSEAEAFKEGEGGPVQDRTAGCVSPAGSVKATLYSLENYSCGLPVVNGGLRVKDFATLYLGEYRITKFSRRLTMLRVELGCATGGSLNLGEGSGNGQWEPPD